MADGQYYVYGDSQTGSMQLIGEPVQGEGRWIDRGPIFTTGFTTQPYVPTTPSAVPQNQGFPAIVLSGGDTLNLVLSRNVPSKLRGATIVLDDGQAIAAAAAAFVNSGSGTRGGSLVLPPDAAFTSYVINYPVTLPYGAELLLHNALVANETLTLSPRSNLRADVVGSNTCDRQFGVVINNCISGLANHMVRAIGGEHTIANIGFVDTTGNHEGMLFIDDGAEQNLYNLGFTMGNRSTVGMVVEGQVAGLYMHNFSMIGKDPTYHNGDTFPGGDPLFAGILNRAATWDAGCLACMPSGQVLDGESDFGGRGILWDFSQLGIGVAGNNLRYHGIWNQAPTEPTVELYGGSGFIVRNVDIHFIINDTAAEACFGNLGAGVSGDVSIRSCTNAIYPNGVGFAAAATGSYTPGLTLVGLQPEYNGATTGHWQPPGLPANGSYFGPSYGNGLYAALGAPLMFTWPSVAPAAWEFAPNNSLTVSSVSVGGSVPVGSHWYCVSPVSWMGAWGKCSNAAYATTTTGNQTVNLSWTATSYARGYKIFRDGKVCPNPAPNFAYDTTLTTWSDTLGSGTCNGLSAPTVGSAGQSSIDGTQHIAPLLRAVSTNGLSTSLSTDANGSPLLNGYPLNAVVKGIDFFLRADGGLGANWSQTAGSFNITSHTVSGGNGGTTNLVAWVGPGNFSSGAAQFSQTVVTGLSNTSGQAVGPAVEISGNNAYECHGEGAYGGGATDLLQIRKITAGAAANLITATASAWRFEQVGDQVTITATPSPDLTSVTLTCSVNGQPVLAVTDSSSPFTTGLPGIYDNNAYAPFTVSNWVGGEVPLTISPCVAAGSNAAASAVAYANAPSGLFSVPITTPTSVVVTTTALKSNSVIYVKQRLDSTSGAGAALGVTCNAVKNATTPEITARAATSFTILVTPFITNPGCYEYHVFNQ
jgi:hypothetical protein